MTAKRTQRTYNSPLREEQASRTRERILEAFVEQVTESELQDFSIALVAKRAGVSMRTVYHHFPNREAILDALAAWYETHVHFPPVPDTPDGIRDFVEASIKAIDSAGSFVRAMQAHSSGLVGEVRQWGRSGRRGAMQRLVRSACGELTDEQMKRGMALLNYILSSNTWRFLKDDAAMEVEEIIDSITWAVETLLDDLRREAEARAATAREEGARSQ
jgi:AcrR family transcriptional regulator